MQVILSTKCRYCDILLEGREQFVGHMIHSHDMPFEQGDVAWKSVCVSAQKRVQEEPQHTLNRNVVIPA